MRDGIKRRYPNALNTCYTDEGFTGKPDGDWAWAADGIERTVTVTVPDFGEYRLSALPAGTIYLVAQQADKRNVIWFDQSAMKPVLNR